ncbi:MAG: peroxiredoxin [Balneolales bacterium]
MSLISANVLMMMLAASLLTIPAIAFGQDEGPGVGDQAPEFEARSDDGNMWSSKDVVGESLLVVYFYPAAMTGGCTAQACSFRDDRTKLTEMGAEVIGISGDNVNSLQIFRRANNLNFPLLSDPDGSIARSFGVPLRDGGTITREIDGQEVELTREVSTSRWTFIIDREGKIVYKDTDVNASGDSQTVMAAIERLR